MRHTLAGVVPIGSPWGGPESRRYLSGLVSLLLYHQGHREPADGLYARHESLYHQYLLVSGIGVSTCWNAAIEPFAPEAMVDQLTPDYVERTMAYAGLRYEVLTAGEIADDPASTARRVETSLVQGLPVLAQSHAAEWYLITGCERDGRTWMGWDGARSYWGPPALAPDRYLDDGQFVSTAWPATTGRLVLVDGERSPRTATAWILGHAVEVMRQQQEAGLDQVCWPLLADDAFYPSAVPSQVAQVWGYVDGFFGWYAENRCFVGMSLHEQLATAPDVVAVPGTADLLHQAASFMIHSHEASWEGWRADRAHHRCARPAVDPCQACGGCLRPADERDLAIFRLPDQRRRILGWLQVLAFNDRKTRRLLERGLARLSDRGRHAGARNAAATPD
jgi:hypothetical protein